MAQRRRNKRRKLSNKRILILCEGKTEKLYLENLRSSLPRQLQRDIRLDISQAKHGEPVKMISEFKRKLSNARREKQAYTYAWVVFDDDNRDLHSLFQKLEKNKIKFVYNSISIEFWFLQHFKNTTRQFQSCSELIPELEKAGLKQYNKTDTEFWDKLEDKYETAKKRAEKLNNRFNNGKIKWIERKPYSNFYELVDLILKMNKY